MPRVSSTLTEHPLIQCTRAEAQATIKTERIVSPRRLGVSQFLTYISIIQTEPMIASFSSSGYRAGTIPEVNMLLISSKNPKEIRYNMNKRKHLLKPICVRKWQAYTTQWLLYGNPQTVVHFLAYCYRRKGRGMQRWCSSIHGWVWSGCLCAKPDG